MYKIIILRLSHISPVLCIDSKLDGKGNNSLKPNYVIVVTELYFFYNENV